MHSEPRGPFGNRAGAFDPEPGPEALTRRDASGRFLAGTKGGPGNPLAARVNLLRLAAFDECTPDDVRAMLRALIERARTGDVEAFRAIAPYVLGKPSPPPDLDDDGEGLPARFVVVIPDARERIGEQ